MKSHHIPDVPQLQNNPQMAQNLLESISAIVEVINTRQLHYRQRLSLILQIILEYLGVEQGSILIIHRRKLVVEAASREELLGLAQPLDGDSIAAHVARTGESEFIKDITKDRRFPNRQDNGAYRSKSLLSVPIKQDDRVLGVLNVTDKCCAKNLLQEEDIVYLMNFSSLVLSLIVQETMLAEIKKQRNALKKKNEALRKAQELQAELSKMLIHDIKGPLSEVVANLDILSFSVDAEQKEFLSAAQLSSDRAVRMASDLGSVAKIEDGSMRLVKELVDPSQMLDEALISVRGLAKIKNVTLQQQSSDNLPKIQLDRVLIERVLQNLLINALGYSPDNISITVGCRPHADDRQLLFFVADQGVGIAPEEQHLVFEKYARLRTRHSILVGTGLGLYFCKLVVEHHKGSIGIESSTGVGSTFYFSLPL